MIKVILFFEEQYIGMTYIVTSSFGFLSTKWMVLRGQLVWRRGTLVTNFDGHSETQCTTAFTESVIGLTHNLSYIATFYETSDHGWIKVSPPQFISRHVRTKSPHLAQLEAKSYMAGQLQTCIYNRVSCLTRHRRNMEHGRNIGKSYVWPVETLETTFVNAIIIIFWRWAHIYQVDVPTISLLNGDTLVSLEASNQHAGNDHQQTIFKSLGSLRSQHHYCMDGLLFWSPPRSVLISYSKFSVDGHSLLAVIQLLSQHWQQTLQTYLQMLIMITTAGLVIFRWYNVNIYFCSSYS